MYTIEKVDDVYNIRIIYNVCMQTKCVICDVDDPLFEKVRKTKMEMNTRKCRLIPSIDKNY